MASQNLDPALAAAAARRKDKSCDSPNKKDGHSVSTRLQKELMSLMMKCSGKGISAFPEDDNIFKWIGTIEGPAESVYESLKYKLSLEFPSRYPHVAPTVKFVTPIFHPNVDNDGNICLDILKEKWSALYDVGSLLMSLQILLGEPNNDSPLNVQAAELWTNQAAYKKTVLEKYHKATSK
ncbi:ubiquitin-conjugating enzyme E2 C [Strongylocentrotus purpuratus]|uniref:Ubiquitin-conjugating enzyme E2 C n=1 Tax=Strongylocentrotus purpuratus TaxID=7668 RepID=A0A7M7TH34_STRPU|nr:ubiquitin-conjugating enzyme E2 C [Strongylocentrotus purpuratus]|eukprot:XP_011675318.1 PREDICTED: ubiquitin-conjugating enzyme E2 C isoform X1 [Strongylocentrotus purpuratus]